MVPSGHMGSRTAMGSSSENSTMQDTVKTHRWLLPGPCLLTTLTSFSASRSLAPGIDYSFSCLRSPGDCSGRFHELASWTQTENWSYYLPAAFWSWRCPHLEFILLKLSSVPKHPMHIVPKVALYFRAMAANWQWHVHVSGSLCSPHCFCRHCD